MAEKKMINVLLVKPGCAPEEITVENKYETWRELVGGYIEMPAYFSDVDIICNEEGKLLGLPVNRIMTLNKKPFDVVVGNIVITGFTLAGATKGLNAKQIAKYKKIFSDVAVEIEG